MKKFKRVICAVLCAAICCSAFALNVSAEAVKNYVKSVSGEYAAYARYHQSGDYDGAILLPLPFQIG